MPQQPVRVTKADYKLTDKFAVLVLIKTMPIFFLTRKLFFPPRGF